MIIVIKKNKPLDKRLMRTHVCVSKVRSEVQCCSYCGEKIRGHQISFGKSNHSSSYNVWLHPICVGKLAKLVKKTMTPELESRILLEEL